MYCLINIVIIPVLVHLNNYIYIDILLILNMFI